MFLLFLAYLGGALTIVSPCILPVLPFVFARAGQPFARTGFPLLLGMAVTFAGVATLAAIGGGWAVEANSYGRAAALVVLAGFGLLLLFPRLADRAMHPLVALGARLSQPATGDQSATPSFVASVLLGVATGLLWAPCAGPILGLVLTGAALKGASAQTSILLLAYAAGAATSLALALLVGGRVLKLMKRSLGIGERVRRVLGALVLMGVAVIALGLDTGLLTRLSLSGTNRLEQDLLDRFRPARGMPPGTRAGTLPIEGNFPPLTGATAWINSPPLSPETLRGKVVLIDFWTYSCINCLRALPYVRAWAEKYKTAGLVVIGVHTPEFAFEKNPTHVEDAVRRLGITFPVAMDNNNAIWRAFDNQYWPADYIIDGKGRIRAHHFGEGDYAETEKIIQRLIVANGRAAVDSKTVVIDDTGVSAPADADHLLSPETYLGWQRGERMVSAGGYAPDVSHTYTVPPVLALNDWGLAGAWMSEPEQAIAQGVGSRLVFRFHARDLHLVLGPSDQGHPVRFRVKLDGKTPGNDHGIDIDAAGNGVVTTERLFQLVRQKSKSIGDKTFEIQFLDAGVHAFAFTFG